ncbi:hypothetical protein MFLAVUS_005951 [Mucor flavus]|uniref:Uncharacterized protein n=1 Tax=Mucor flavus TaxID=439312 RepID=A0ABP9Z075_9FUNG
MYRPPPVPYGGSPVMGSPQNIPFNPNATWQRPMDPAAIWKEHTTPEGRKYWFNNITRQSTWEKPEDLLTPEEKILKGSSWKEYTTPEGKKYYSNIKTKETVWEIPADLKEQLEKAKKLAIEIQALTSAAPPHSEPVRVPAPSMSVTMTQPLPEYATRELAEQAFFGLLKETGVKSDWTWEQAQRAIITKPLYRALKTITERKAAFHMFIDAEAKREREEREQREARQKANFISMLQKQDIKPYTRFRTVLKQYGQLPQFTEIKSEKQAESYFDEYIQTIQREEKDRLRDLRKSSMEKFSKLLHSIPEITYKTSWKEAQYLYQNTPVGKNLESFEGMDMLDFLSVFEEYNRSLWEEPMDEINKKVHQRRRKERKAREGFKELLQELVSNNQINVRTLWKDIYPQIKDDSRYISAVGLPDSTPLDMFWDVIDDLDEQLYHQKKTVYAALKKADFEVDMQTQFDDYLDALNIDERVKLEINHQNLKFIFEHLQVKAAQRLKDEKRRQEKKLRKKLDIFKYALKHVDPPITVEDTWETVKPRLQVLEEYNEIEQEELKQEVFEKYLNRLKEKKEDEDEEEEGMIKEDEEGMIREDDDIHEKRRSRRSRRKEYGSDSDEENRIKKKKKRHTSKGYSSTEEGEALDDYQNDPRRLK